MSATIVVRLKEIKKRRALRGKHPSADGLMNSVGKRTVVVLNPSFFYFFNPFFVIGNFKIMRTIAILLLTTYFCYSQDKKNYIPGHLVTINGHTADARTNDTIILATVEVFDNGNRLTTGLSDYDGNF